MMDCTALETSKGLGPETEPDFKSISYKLAPFGAPASNVANAANTTLFLKSNEKMESHPGHASPLGHVPTAFAVCVFESYRWIVNVGGVVN